jgi:uncharacterized protein YndB with AHSA1/START domain
MSGFKELRIAPRGAREIVVTRGFDAPRDLVFDAMTRPEFVKQWLWGPDEWRMAVCEIDFRVGGRFRWVWRHSERGTDMGMGGTYLEIERPARIVHTELFDEDWTGGEVRIETVLNEVGGRTTMTMTLLYATTEARDAVLQSGMADGMQQSYSRLDPLLASGACATPSG